MNAVTTGWELITFSFVIDWIIDIGQWLEAMSFLVMQTNYEAARGLQLSIERETTIAGTSTSHYSDFIVNHESYCVGTFTRRLPCGVSKLPSFGMNLNALKIVDILALLAKFRR